MTSQEYKTTISHRMSGGLSKICEKQVSIELKQQLSHLLIVKKGKTVSTLISPHVTAPSISDLSLANVPFRHSFPLTDDYSVCQSARIVALKHIDIMREELYVKVTKGIIKPKS